MRTTSNIGGFLFSLVFFLVMHSSSTYAQGIVFDSGKWNSILQKANKENKLVFVDAFTTWCGPCVIMSKDVFPLKTVGDYFNKNYINVKIDQEKGEGIEFAKKYSVKAFPTLLIINAKGEIVDKHIGFVTAEKLLEFAKNTNENKEGVPFHLVKKDYLNNKTNFNKFKKYASLLNIQRDRAGLSMLFKETTADKQIRLTVSKEMISFYKNYKNYITLGDVFFKNIYENYDKYNSIIGSDEIGKLYEEIYNNAVFSSKTVYDNKKVKEYVSKTKKDKYLKKKVKEYIVDRIILYGVENEYKKILKKQKINNSTTEEDEWNKVSLKYRNVLVAFVKKNIKKIYGKELLSFKAELGTINFNAKTPTKSEDLILEKKWMLLTVEKEKRNPEILHLYAMALFSEGKLLMQDKKNDLAKEKRYEAIAIIEECVRKERLKTSINERNLRFFYGTEAYIKRGYEDSPRRFYKLKEVADIIKENYIYPSHNTERKYIELLVSSLDSHSKIIAFPEMSNLLTLNINKLGGVGMNLTMVDERPMVITLVNDSPAQRAGLKLGDIIVGINNKKLTKWNNSEEAKGFIHDNVFGEIGSFLDIKVKRGDKVIDFNLERKKINDNAVVAQFMVDKNIGYIKLTRFGYNCHQQVKDAVVNLKSQGMNRLIFDLTNNTGGLKDQAIKIADEFIAGDKVIVSTERQKKKEEFRTKPEVTGVFEEGELVVMINEKSASSSELLSGALQDYDRATLIGRRSFGKGTVQGTYTLKDGSGIRLTNSRFIFPSGRCPDIIFPNKKRPSRQELIKSGELTNKDSVVFYGEEFETASGKKVYGNSGVMPEIFVPLNLKYQKEAYKTIKNKQLVFLFVVDYLADKKERNKIQKLGKDKAVKKLTINKEMWQKFVGFCEKKGNLKSDELQQMKGFLKNEIKAMTILNIWNDVSACFKVLNLNKDIYNRAISNLEG